MGKSKNKKNLTTLAKNIKALREFYGESQETLGKKINLSQPAINNYERDIRKPDTDKLKVFADHFGVTMSQLLQQDFTDAGRPSLNLTVFYKYIDTLFPIVFTDESLQNESFKKSYNMHKNLYNVALSFNSYDLTNTSQFDSFGDGVWAP